MTFIQLLLPTIEHFYVTGYWVAFFAALLETIIGFGMFIPGSTIILFMGTLASKGYLDLGDLIWFAVIGAMIGDNVNYFFGKKYGLNFFGKYFLFIKQKHFEKGEKFFKNHGYKSIFIGRFIPGLKEIMPLIVGIFGMKRFSFMIWDILGVVSWSLVWILPGYFFAESFGLTKIWLTRAGLFMIALVVFFIVFYILKIVFIRKGKKFFLFLFSIWRSIKQAISKNQDVQNFVKRHEKFFQFIKRRLDKKSFFGLPLSLLSLALFYALLHFGGVVEGILTSNVIVFTDIRVANLLSIFRDKGLIVFFTWITLLGKWQIVSLFAISAILIMWIWKKSFYIFPLLLSIVGSEFFTSIGKLVFHRPRPVTAIYSESSFSFPSGHATIAVAFYGFLSYFLIKNFNKWKYKINIFFFFLLIILLIGFSRLYLGVHYVSDVWGGYLIGSIWLIISISLVEFILLKKQIKLLHKISVKKIKITIAIVVISVGIYILYAFYYQTPIITYFPEIRPTKVSAIAKIFNIEQLKFTKTLSGQKQEPLSFIIIAKDDKQFIDLFQRANWFLADDITISSMAESAKAAIRKQSYPQAPMTPSFWNTRLHDFGFEKSTDSNNVRTRHHARFWKTNYLMENGDHIYLGTASFDSGIKWGITHKISPDIDTEREFMFDDLKKTNMLLDIQKQQFVKPILGNNFSGDPFFTDGKTYTLKIK